MDEQLAKKIMAKEIHASSLTEMRKAELIAEVENESYRPAFSRVEHEPDSEFWTCEIVGCTASGYTADDKAAHMGSASAYHEKCLEESFKSQLRKSRARKNDPILKARRRAELGLDVYERFGETRYDIECPNCHHTFEPKS